MRTWLEVDLNQLKKNVDVVKNVLPEHCDLIAVIKANAYGHGSVRISQYLESIGVNRFAVASLSEALELRKAGIKSDILVLSYVDSIEVMDAYENNITLSAVSMDYVTEINKIALSNSVTIKMHMKINTGMNRVGFNCVTSKDLEEIKRAYDSKGILFTGIFSHFSSSDDLSCGAEDYTKIQIERFNTVLNYLKTNNINVGLKHISNSGGIAKYKEARYNAVRCGALLYGYNTAIDCPLDVKPIGTWKAKISCVRALNKDDAVSYSRHYIAKGNEKIATLCVGYADGYKRLLSGKEDGSHGYVLIQEKQCPIIGNICMDQMMVDVSGIDVKMNDTAILIGDKLSADDLAELSQSCMHDILSSIGSRVERIYFE